MKKILLLVAFFSIASMDNMNAQTKVEIKTPHLINIDGKNFLINIRNFNIVSTQTVGDTIILNNFEANTSKFKSGMKSIPLIPFKGTYMYLDHTKIFYYKKE